MRRTAVHKLWRLARWTPVLGVVAVLAAMPGSIEGSSLPIADHDDEPDEPELYAGIDPRDLGLGEVTVQPEQAARPVGEVVWTSSSQQEVESSEEVVSRLGTSGIPEVALRAYTRAQETSAVTDPGCGVSWSLLAAIGRVESNHGRYGGAQLRTDGYGTRKIRGIPLDGRPGIALIRDSDDGSMDGDTVYDRAVGPMQFIPSSWRAVAADGNGDGREDPDNIFDATLGSATYLCAGSGNLRDRGQRSQAVFRYNRSQEYVNVVMSLADSYEQGQGGSLPHEEPADSPPPALPRPPGPPANHGPPPGLPPEPPSGPPPTTPPTTPPPTRPPQPPIRPCPAVTTTSSTSSTTSTTAPTTTTTRPPWCPPVPTTTTTTTTTTSTTQVPATDPPAPSTTSSPTTGTTIPA